MLAPTNLALARGLVPDAYLDQGAASLARRCALARVLLAQRRLPPEGWPDAAITAFLGELSAMDSNNFAGAVGAGEREARIFSPLVAARHWGLGHGVGRSGDIAAVQPKAAGSSLLYALTNRLALHAVRLCGITRAAAALVLPLATGMSLTLCLLALRANRPPLREVGGAGPSFVVWSRIDQKSAFKCILTAGFQPLPVEPLLEGDELVTDVAGIRAAIAAAGGPDAIVAVLTTTSCFAPRGPDKLLEVGALCAELGVPHLVNHAYGLQASATCHILNEACRGWPPTPSRQQRGGGGARQSGGSAAASAGGGGGSVMSHDGDDGGGGVGVEPLPPPCRVDAWVSSTDKNFMVPVGGSLVCSSDTQTVEAISRSYPGRASSAPIVDLFITFLSMGEAGLKRLLAQRKAIFPALNASMQRIAAAHGERVLHSPHNPISLAMTLSTITAGRDTESSPVTTTPAESDNGADASVVRTAAAPSHAAATYLGSMLFSRGVSGTRVVPRGAPPTRIGPCTFHGYGASTDEYPYAPYVTAAAAMGMTLEDVALFEQKLERTIAEFKRQKTLGACADTIN